MEAPRLEQRTLTDFFRETVQRAFRRQAVESSEQTEFYLVNLLERFANPHRSWDSRPLALEYLESFHSPAPCRYAKLKHVGDTALFLSGIFMENLERRLASTDYYISLGRLAYHQLGAPAGRPPTGTGPLFQEMADRFPDLVRVLTEISFSDLFPSDRQTVRIYTRWLRTRGRQDAEWLLRHGLIPFGADIRSESRH